MKPLFKSYLKKVCLMISKKNRVATYTELRSHLLQEFDELRKNQNDPQATFQNMMRSKPNPYWLGYKMRRAQQSFLRRNFISLSFAFGFMLFLIVGQYINQMIQNEYLPASRQTTTTAKNEEQFEKDLKFLARHPQKEIFTSLKAHPADDQVYQHLSELRNDENKKIVKSYTKFRFNQYFDATDLKTLETADLEWIESLQKFDFVSALSSEDIQKFQNNLDGSFFRKIGLHSSLNGNNLPELGQMALAYTYKLCSKKECPKGLKHLRHVAQLMYTANGGFYIQHSAINLLKQESYFVKKFDLKNYASLDPEFLNAHERVYWGWMGIIGDMFKKNDFSDKWNDYMKPELGVCSGINLYAFGWYLSGSDLMNRHWPLEIDFSKEIEKEKVVLDQFYQKCGMPIYSKLIHTRYNQAKPLALSLSLTPSFLPESLQPWINEARVPYFRQLLAFYILKTFNGSYWKVYERLPPQVD